MSFTSDDIVNGVRQNGRKERQMSVNGYNSWWEVAKGYEPEFLDWLLDHGGSLDEEKEDFVNIGYVDESFPEFMYKAFENS